MRIPFLTTKREAWLLEWEFSDSWKWMQGFYRGLIDDGWVWLTPILDVIARLQARKFDRKLRPGQSMWIFVLSRSKRHGLRTEQLCLTMDVHRNGSMTVSYYDPPSPVVKVEVERVEVTPEVEALPVKLADHALD